MYIFKLQQNNFLKNNVISFLVRTLKNNRGVSSKSSVTTHLPVYGLAQVSRLFLVSICTYLFFVSFAVASLQIASTVTLEGDSQVVEGMVVVADEDSGTYAVSSVTSDAQVFGVTASAPSLVFMTGDNKTPVVTEGVSFVRVVDSNGSIKRGDLLVTSSVLGAAMRAEEGDQNVFAIALEAPQTQGADAVNIVQAEIGSDRARAAQATLAQVTTEEKEISTAPSVVRESVAVVLVVGALFFILYSFRSTIVQGVVSIGRNPKARRSIVTLLFANIAFALVLCAIVVFIAIAILVLPI